jgi:hypothetical protein
MRFGESAKAAAAHMDNFSDVVTSQSLVSTIIDEGTGLAKSFDFKLSNDRLIASAADSGQLSRLRHYV